MVSIFLSGLVGVGVGLIGILVMVVFDLELSKYFKKLALTFVIVGCIVGMFIGWNIDVHRYGSYIDQYTSAKTTIESSIHNDQLSGFEKIELVKQATEENKELAAKQYDARQWYGFVIPDEILELEPISIE